MCDIIFTHRASGRKVRNHFHWDRVTWTKCSCGLYHSNRDIPPEFWKRKWKKKKKREKVGIMIIKNNYIWVTQSYNKCFGFPKGEKEHGETDEDTCIREFKEETGSIIDKKFLKDSQKIVIKVRDIKYTFFVLFVKNDFSINTTPEDDVEITSFGWKNINNIYDLHLSKAIKKTLHIFFKRNYINTNDSNKK